MAYSMPFLCPRSENEGETGHDGFPDISEKSVFVLYRLYPSHEAHREMLKYGPCLDGPFSVDDLVRYGMNPF